MNGGTKLVMAAWEIGHSNTPFGVKVGGMASVVEELPVEMSDYAADRGMNIAIEVLSPCFRFYDRSKFHYEGRVWVPQFEMDFEVFSHIFDYTPHRQIKHLYFWNEAVLGGFGEAGYSQSVYLSKPWEALRIYARVSAAMARYLMMTGADAIQLHDYHVGYLPFYLDMDVRRLIFTIHNASYQGWLEIWGDPGPVTYELGISQADYYTYFQHWGHFNTLKGVILKVAQSGGVITTVSEGYAQELYWSAQDIQRLALSQGHPFPRQVLVANNGLAELSWVGVCGINNGLSDDKRPDTLKYFQAVELQKLQEKQSKPLFRKPMVQEAMLHHNHNYSRQNMENRQKLRQYLCWECFDGDPEATDVVFCVVGRLAEQKNFHVLLDCIEPILRQYPHVYFIIMATPIKNDLYSEATSQEFNELAENYPDHVYYCASLNEPLSKLVLAGSDFCLVPSRFEPCGLVDYEAAVLGNVPIVRKTGGLVKTLPHAHGYSWYDEADPRGESYTLAKTIAEAIVEYRDHPETHKQRVAACMQLDTSWDQAIAQYFQLLRIG